MIPAPDMLTVTPRVAPRPTKQFVRRMLVTVYPTFVK